MVMHPVVRSAQRTAVILAATAQPYSCTGNWMERWAFFKQKPAYVMESRDWSS
eukprot:COSAG05_NODE_17055_length_333_cov_0.444444_1_plen_52_part_10